MEIWKPILDFEDYLISSCGRIKSIKPRKGARANINNGIISGWIQTIGNNYQRRLVALRKDGKTNTRKVSQLMLETFVGQRKHGQVVRHLDGNSLNNNIENLAWGTQRENIHDSIRHGTMVNPPVYYGESHPSSVISDKDVDLIRNHIYKRGDQAAFARKYGVSDTQISRIRKGLSRQ